MAWIHLSGGVGDQGVRGRRGRKGMEGVRGTPGYPGEYIKHFDYSKIGLCLFFIFISQVASPDLRPTGYKADVWLNIGQIRISSPSLFNPNHIWELHKVLIQTVFFKPIKKNREMAQSAPPLNTIKEHFFPV